MPDPACAACRPIRKAAVRLSRRGDADVPGETVQACFPPETDSSDTPVLFFPP